MTSRDNKEELLDLLQDWKKNYAVAVANSIKPSGDVLQIGFRDQLLADAIASHKPKSHTIVEGETSQYELAVEWAKSHPNVKIVHERWAKALPTLGAFDAIIYQRTSREANPDLELLQCLNRESLSLTAEKAKELLSMLEEQFSQVHVKFSDGDIEDFCRHYSSVPPETIETFFDKLQSNGLITQVQQQKALKVYHEQHNPKPQAKESAASTPDELLACLKECLKSNLKVKGRFSALADEQLSKFADEEFVNQVIGNPKVEYQEHFEALALPPSPFKSRFGKALVFVVEKAA